MTQEAEQAPVPETEKPHFRRMVLGHRPEQIDFDQMAAAAVLRIGGMINGQTEVIATNQPDQDDINSTDVIVLEGVTSTAQNINTRDTNTYINDPTSEDPATFTMAQALRGQLDKQLGGPKTSERRQQLEFINWVRNQENRKAKRPELRLAMAADYDVLKDIWYGLKLQYQLPDQLPQLLEAQHVVVQQLYDTERQQAVQAGNTSRSLGEMYKDQIEQNRQFLEQQKQTIREHVLKGEAINPDHFRIHALANGMNVAVIDVRGTGTDQGAPAIAREVARTHSVDHISAVVIINEEEGEPPGTKLLIQVSDRDRERPHFANDITKTITDRMNLAEAQYGKGFRFTQEAQYGGHEQVMSTPYAGSGMTAEALEQGLIDYLEQPRLSEQEMQTQVEDLANRIGSTQFTLALETGRSTSESGRRIARVTIPPDENGQPETTIMIDETEVHRYLAVLQADPSVPDILSKNRQILRQKQETREAPEIRQLRLQEHAQHIEHAITNADAAAILRELNRLQTGDIQQLDPAILTRAYSLFSQSQRAIDQVYGADRRWRLNDPRVQDIYTDPTNADYQQALFSFHSVPRLIDTDVPRAVHAFAATAEGDLASRTQLQELVGGHMIDILKAPGYQKQPDHHDGHLRTVLTYITDNRIDSAVRQSLAQRLVLSYGERQMQHWDMLAQQNDTAFLTAVSAYPDLFEGIFSQINTERQFQAIPEIPGSFVSPPDAQDTLNRLAQTQEQREASPGLPPDMTILLQLGPRDVSSLIRDRGIRRVQQTDGDPSFTHTDQHEITLDGVLTTPALQQGGERRQEVAVARQVIVMVQALQPVVEAHPNIQIRLVRGNFSTRVAGEVAQAVNSPRIPQAVRDAIIWCDYSADGVYEDGLREVY